MVERISMEPSTIEYIDVINQDGSDAGYRLPRNEVHTKGLWHRVIHVWLADGKGNLLIHKRAANKPTYPSMWNVSTAGHVEAGLSSREAAIKELKEEIGVTATIDQLESKSTLYTSGRFLKIDAPVGVKGLRVYNAINNNNTLMSSIKTEVMLDIDYREVKFTQRDCGTE
eukprot:gene12481-14649_t